MYSLNSLKKNLVELCELLMKGRIKEFFQLLIYYNYKFDLILLYFATLMPYYLIFIFCFFFGNFGSPEGIADGVLFFKYSCFLYSWFIIGTSVFVFISFQIPSSKKHLYNLLGKEYVISCIGNPGVKPLIKLGGAAVGMVCGNEIGKELDGRQKVYLSKAAIDHYKQLVETTGQVPDQRSTEFKKVAEISRKIFETPPKGPFDRNEERVASGQFVDATKDVILKGIGWRK